MSREIKFRAWDILNNRIVKAESIDFKHTMLHLFDETFKDNPTYIVDFKLMQYTGLKDKNGVEIYEGDICKYSSHTILEIKYIKNKCKFDAIKINDDNGTCYKMSEDMATNRLEVIGNIHQNKELLKCN